MSTQPSTSQPDEPTPPAPRTFRLPRSAYLIVLLLLACTVPLALAGDTVHSSGPESTAGSITDIQVGPRMLLLLIPIVVAGFVARTRTTVDAESITVRALFGSKVLAWTQVRGLTLDARSVYAVRTDGGAVRLPCVRISDLHVVAEASGRHLPEIAAPKPKFAASRPRRGTVRRR